MYNIELEQYQVIPIYTDYKEELQYEGHAILLEHKSDGDTYFLNNELVDYVDPQHIQHIIGNSYYSILSSIFKNTRSYLKENITSASTFALFCKEMISSIKNKNDDYNVLYSIILKYKDFVSAVEYLTRINAKNPSIDLTQLGIWKKLFTVPIPVIVKYFQQKHVCDKKHRWQPTVFNWQNWKVQFICNKYGESVNFVTHRKIRFLVKNNPKEYDYQLELKHLMTYNGQNKYRKSVRDNIIKASS